MLHAGLVSVSFRQLSVEVIIKMTADAGLEAIEWGGDVHVPHGDIVCARLVRRMTEDAGLKVSSYGSYYVAGGATNPNVLSVVDTAAELGAPVIRIWAGSRGSADSGDSVYRTVAGDAANFSDLATRANILCAFEYHPNTLTDLAESAARLLDACPGMLCYWQPSMVEDTDERLRGLRSILPRLCNVHVFHWLQNTRLPLTSGAEEWMKYLSIISASALERYCLLEFFKDDSPGQFMEDAQTLMSLLLHMNECRSANCIMGEPEEAEPAWR